jgi:uncharacterized protein YjbI with pentapeptide repeats
MSRNRLKDILLIGLGGVVISIASSLTTLALAHGGNTNLIHACVGTGLLNNGQIRIIDANGSCGGNETALDWSKEGLEAFGGFTTKQLVGYTASRENLSYRNFEGASFQDGQLLNETDMSHSNFKGANFQGADISEANLSSSDFSEVNFTNGFLQFVIAEDTNFTDSDFIGVFLNDSNFDGANFTNADFTNAHLSNATNMSTATVTGATWDNTTCPDSTNSDNNGNTCVGHF